MVGKSAASALGVTWPDSQRICPHHPAMPPRPGPPGHLWEKLQESDQKGIERGGILHIYLFLLMQEVLQLGAKECRDQGYEQTRELNQGLHHSIKRIAAMTSYLKSRGMTEQRGWDTGQRKEKAREVARGPA